jgi:iron complex transport system substrate-binding protein
MKKILSGILVTVLLASAMLISVMPASAAGISSEYKKLFEGDNSITRGELANAILPYMLGGGALQIEELRDAAHVYAYWNGEPRSITDSAKSSVIYKPIKRIVTLTTESTEAVRTLGASDKVVGVTKYVIEDNLFYPEFSGHPNVGSAFSPVDTLSEELLKCNAEMVITYTKYPTPPTLEDKLKGTDIIVIRFDFSKPSTFVEEVNKLGRILEKEKKAGEFINFYSNYMDEIREKVETADDKPRVYLEADFGSGHEKYYTCGKGHGHHELIVLAGGDNIFANVTYGGVISAEDVANRDPEIIVKYKWPAGGFDGNIEELKALREEILGRPELKNVTAVENKTVYVFTWYTTRGAARYFLGIGYLAKWFHPELFEDLDPKANYQKYLREFQGLNIDLDRAALVYPEEPV